jgi:hypothetical protein
MLGGNVTAGMTSGVTVGVGTITGNSLGSEIDAAGVMFSGAETGVEMLGGSCGKVGGRAGFEGVVPLLAGSRLVVGLVVTLLSLAMPDCPESFEEDELGLSAGGLTEVLVSVGFVPADFGARGAESGVGGVFVCGAGFGGVTGLLGAGDLGGAAETGELPIVGGRKPGG